MKKFTNYCPSCGKERVYSSNTAMNYAKRNKTLCRICAKRKQTSLCIANTELFEEDSLKFYYWIGFIMADGHISNNRLKICLSIKDSEHLYKLSKELKLTPKIDRGNVCISFMNNRVIGELVDRFKIESNKTEHPCYIPNDLTIDQLKSLSIGFIDGDGSIKKQSGGRRGALIKIQCHSSWLSNLKKMFLKSYINPNGYAQVYITRHKDCKDLKEFAIANSLPIMSRKWDKIDLTFKTKYEKQ
jgi:hypothetical protein